MANNYRSYTSYEAYCSEYPEEEYDKVHQKAYEYFQFFSPRALAEQQIYSEFRQRWLWKWPSKDCPAIHLLIGRPSFEAKVDELLPQSVVRTDEYQLARPQVRLQPEPVIDVPDFTPDFSGDVSQVLPSSSEEVDNGTISTVRYQVAIMRLSGMLASGKNKAVKKTHVVQKKKKFVTPLALRNAELFMFHRGIGMPSRFTTNLDFNDQTTLRNNVGVLGASWRYAMNSLYTIDQVSASVVPYRLALTGFYRKYRVNHCSCSFTVTNNEAFNIIAGIYPSGDLIDPGLNTSVNWQVGPDKPGALHRGLGAIGGMNTHTFRLPPVKISKLFNASAKYDPNFEGTGGAPANQVWFVPWFKSVSGTVLVAGVTIDFVMTPNVTFYDRIDQFQ